MHAYLFIKEKENNIKDKIQELLNITEKIVFDFPVKKIEDVRELGKFTKLSQNSPIFVKIENIDESTPEAQNALLKSLEEPPKNINYIITAGSERGVLPTILSRCKIFYVSEDIIESFSEIVKFIKSDPFDRVSFVEKIKDRQEALSFVKKFIFYYHNQIKEQKNISSITDNLLKTQKALDAIKRNGNIYLQLANFTINFS